jgi:hypothetical protein
MITGLRVIWRSMGNKFHIVLFTVLAAISVCLLFPLSRDDMLLLSSLMLGGVIFFILFALLALIPPVWRFIESVRRLVVVQSVLFLLTAFVAPLLLLLTSRTVADFFIYSGFTVWLILIGLLSCSLAYSVSNAISLRSPHIIGWIFVFLAVLLDAGLFYEALGHAAIMPLLVFYTVAWFVPCVVLALSEYHHPNLFQAYSLIALVYTAFPIAYRLLSLVSGPAPIPGRLSSILSSPPIEEVVTTILLIFALNALGNFFGRHYGKLKDGGRRLVSRLRRSPQESPIESQYEAKRNDEVNLRKEAHNEKELLLGPFLIFGLLFSALAYFAFVHARGALGIPQYLEPSISFVISVLAAIPLLFFIMRRKR